MPRALFAEHSHSLPMQHPFLKLQWLSNTHFQPSQRGLAKSGEDLSHIPKALHRHIRLARNLVAGSTRIALRFIFGGSKSAVPLRWI